MAIYVGYIGYVEDTTGDNASSTQRHALVDYIEDSQFRTGDKCRCGCRNRLERCRCCVMITNGTDRSPNHGPSSATIPTLRKFLNISCSMSPAGCPKLA